MKKKPKLSYTSPSSHSQKINLDRIPKIKNIRVEENIDLKYLEDMESSIIIETRVNNNENYNLRIKNNNQCYEITNIFECVLIKNKTDKICKKFPSKIKEIKKIISYPINSNKILIAECKIIKEANYFKLKEYKNRETVIFANSENLDSFPENLHKFYLKIEIPNFNLPLKTKFQFLADSLPAADYVTISKFAHENDVHPLYSLCARNLDKYKFHLNFMTSSFLTKILFNCQLNNFYLTLFSSDIFLSNSATKSVNMSNSIIYKCALGNIIHLRLQKGVSFEKLMLMKGLEFEKSVLRFFICDFNSRSSSSNSSNSSNSSSNSSNSNSSSSNSNNSNNIYSNIYNTNTNNINTYSNTNNRNNTNSNIYNNSNSNYNIYNNSNINTNNNNSNIYNNTNNNIYNINSNSNINNTHTNITNNTHTTITNNTIANIAKMEENFGDFQIKKISEFLEKNFPSKNFFKIFDENNLKSINSDYKKDCEVFIRCNDLKSYGRVDIIYSSPINTILMELKSSIQPHKSHYLQLQIYKILYSSVNYLGPDINLKLYYSVSDRFKDLENFNLKDEEIIKERLSVENYLNGKGDKIFYLGNTDGSNSYGSNSNSIDGNNSNSIDCIDSSNGSNSIGGNNSNSNSNSNSNIIIVVLYYSNIVYCIVIVKVLCLNIFSSDIPNYI